MYTHHSRAEALTYTLMRVAAGFFFLMHGGQKLFGWFGGLGGHGATAALNTMPGAGGVIEFFGGCLLLLGLFTRPAAFVMAGEMAVAYFMMHFPKAVFPIQNGGEPAVLYCFMFLFFAAHGGGAYSLDAVLHRRRHPFLHDTGFPAHAT